MDTERICEFARTAFQQLKDDGNELAECITIRSYSGRGMYGDTCFAITGTNIDTCFEMVAAIINSAVRQLHLNNNEYQLAKTQDLVNTLLGSQAKWDNMGRDIVMYWPDVPFTPEPDAEITEDE